MTAVVAPSAIDRLTTDFLSRSPAHLIGGGWVPARAGRTFETVNPATGERLADVALGDAGDIDAAVQAARRALDGRWGKASHATRARLLFKLADLIEAHAEELALLETLDNGKPFRRRAQVDLAERGRGPSATSRAGRPRSTASRSPIPHGNVLAYTRARAGRGGRADRPVELPAHDAAWKLAPALAAGSTVVMKPAEQTPLTALLLGELILEAGLPGGRRQRRHRRRRRPAPRSSAHHGRRQGRVHGLDGGRRRSSGRRPAT